MSAKLKGSLATLLALCITVKAQNYPIAGQPPQEIVCNSLLWGIEP